MDNIEKFDGPYRFLSNFIIGQNKITFEGDEYPTVEHAYQAAKTLSAQERAMVLTYATASGAKKVGKALTLRKDWEQVKLGIMNDLVRQKFKDPQLAQQLLDTGDVQLIEGNWWNDTFWGVSHGRGENHLGKILMAIRDELRKAAG